MIKFIYDLLKENDFKLPDEYSSMTLEQRIMSLHYFMKEIELDYNTRKKVSEYMAYMNTDQYSELFLKFLFPSKYSRRDS
ncbi:hypothetical protein [Paenibacillus popilliae]|uniref:Uncharacterized protein n=1 Tax=Paenibacillus popilliae TaxID=78057 RepID=A0ABY3AHA8_PAEPP|nr:hypothetical protein [Paenibacillus sp. SDF0028]TQR40173.1 hypothetical protein C7Y44_28215 [Paenibacillus sp. SDF0028]